MNAKKTAIGRGAEEERAMATTIVPAKASEMATVTEMEMATATAKANAS